MQIDIDPTRIGLRAQADVGLVGDCATVLDLLLMFLPQKEDRGFLEKSQTAHADLERAHGGARHARRTSR